MGTEPLKVQALAGGKAAQNKAAILTITLTGERSTAATVALVWSDINLADEGKETIIFKSMKNRRQRIVFIPPMLVDALKELAKFGCKPKDRVFCWETRAGLSRMIVRARRSSGIGELRPHDIGRHGFGRRMTQKGKLQTQQLKRAGNWKSDAAVSRYQHFDIDEIAEAVRDVDTSELLPNTTEKSVTKR